MIPSLSFRGGIFSGGGQSDLDRGDMHQPACARASAARPLPGPHFKKEHFERANFVCSHIFSEFRRDQRAPHLLRKVAELLPAPQAKEDSDRSQLN